jgi:hypothetical protein
MFGWISLLLACEAPPAPAPPAPAPAAPVPVAAPVPPPRPPEPDQNEFCDAEGWCWPYVTFADASTAATDGALALGKAGGPAVLWADGRWVGGIDRIRGEVEALTRDGDALLVDVCRKEGCERIRWTPGGADPPVPVARPRPVDPRRLGDWRVRYSTLIRADGLKLSPGICATWFGILGDARAPFVECFQWGNSTVFRVDGDRLVPMTELWGTDWMTRTSQVVQWGAGCAPCITTEKRFVLRDGDGRWRLIPLPDADWFEAAHGPRGVAAAPRAAPPGVGRAAPVRVDRGGGASLGRRVAQGCASDRVGVRGAAAEVRRRGAVRDAGGSPLRHR